MKSKPAKPKSQDSFEAVAKRLECDPDMAAFDKKLAKIATAKVSQGGKVRGKP